MPRQSTPDILGVALGTPDQVILSQLRYDYLLVPAEKRVTVKAAAVEIVRYGQRAQESLIEVGKRLTQVKALLDHGQFSEWCATEFDMSQRTAQRMMQVATAFDGKSDTVSLLSDSALYLLAAPSTPEEAREAVIAEAQATGQSPTKARTQEIIASHQPAWASVWQLESCVTAVADRSASVGGPELRNAAKSKAGALWDGIEYQVATKHSIMWRKGDLVQAINNVAARFESSQRPVNSFSAAPTAPAAMPAMPADLVSRGWEMRRLSTGRYFCNNANGPRATAVHARPEDAINEARTMQIDVTGPTASVGDTVGNDSAGIAVYEGMKGIAVNTPIDSDTDGDTANTGDTDGVSYAGVDVASTPDYSAAAIVTIDATSGAIAANSDTADAAAADNRALARDHIDFAMSGLKMAKMRLSGVGDYVEQIDAILFDLRRMHGELK